MTAEQLRDWARMMEIEFVHITKDTTVEGLGQELFLNDLAWKLKKLNQGIKTPEASKAPSGVLHIVTESAPQKCPIARAGVRGCV